MLLWALFTSEYNTWKAAWIQYCSEYGAHHAERVAETLIASVWCSTRMARASTGRASAGLVSAAIMALNNTKHQRPSMLRVFVVRGAFRAGIR
jgi:hypothetical protein